MLRSTFYLVAAAVVFALGGVSGVIIQKYNAFLFAAITVISGTILGIAFRTQLSFPYERCRARLRRFLHSGTDDTQWSIGLCHGSTPFELSEPKHDSNPILTPHDVTDIAAKSVADPFMVHENGTYTMFFEVMNRDTCRGAIGCATSADGKNWSYRKIVIDEPFHLSYPHVFEWNGDHYLIPESSEDLSVRLYKASSFPDSWEYLGNLLSGFPYVDPTIFQFRDKWWLFVSNPNGDVTNLYYSESLLSGWSPHPKNPIVRFNPKTARPGGRVFSFDGKLFRLAQDGRSSYGFRTFALEITDISETSYEEKLLAKRPIVSAGNRSWNAAGMHHVDAQQIGDRWVAAVDGRSR
jgi:hypothetical protein